MMILLLCFKYGIAVGNVGRNICIIERDGGGGLKVLDRVESAFEVYTEKAFQLEKRAFL